MRMFGLFPMVVGALLIRGVGAAGAQEVTPEVQRLYAEAQAAQERQDTRAAIADYRKILERAPTLAAAYNNLGRLLYNAGQFGQAVDVLEQGLRVNPEMPPARVMLGASEYQLGRFADAEPMLEQGVAAMPQDRFARLTLVRTMLAMHRTADAAAQLQVLVDADAKDQEAWFLLGKAHLEMSQQAFQRVQAIDPNSALAHELEGDVMDSLQNTPGAIAAYKQALAASPGDPTAEMRLADVYWRTGDWKNARAGYQRVLLAEPGNCVARWRMANAADEMGEAAADSKHELDVALEACPQLAQAHAERARLLLRMGKPAEAVTDLKIAEAGAPNEPSVQQMLSQAYRALGKTGEAQAASRRFAELDRAMHEAKEKHAASVIQANQ